MRRFFAGSVVSATPFTAAATSRTSPSFSLIFSLVCDASSLSSFNILGNHSIALRRSFRGPSLNSHDSTVSRIGPVVVPRYSSQGDSPFAINLRIADLFPVVIEFVITVPIFNADPDSHAKVKLFQRGVDSARESPLIGMVNPSKSF